MTTNVTVQTSASTSVLVPFTSATNAALAQTALANANVAASAGFLQYFSPPNTSGAVSLPSVPFFGGVVDTVPAALNFGIMDPKYTTLVNAGSGLAVAIGGVNTTLVSGANASTIYVNQSTSGQAFIGGGNNVLSNAFSISNLTAVVDSVPGGTLGGSTLILDDKAGGTMNVTVGAGLLVALESGGADSIMAQGGTVAILAHQGGSLSGIATISAAASTDVWVGAQGAPVFITPGAGNAFVFQGVSGSENSATLFGGTKTIGGVSRTAAAYTGQTTVLGMNGYLESGSAGGSIMTTGTTAGAATLVAGGAGDILFVNAANDLANLGNAANVIMSAGAVTSGGGVTAVFGSGTGQAFGGAMGHNTFNFTGAGNYTVAGFHEVITVSGGAPTIIGSTYNNMAGAGGAGVITISDFLPQQVATVTGGGTVGGAIFDTFNLGNATVATLTSTEIGTSGFFNNVAVLSDGTTINFLNTAGAVHVQGTAIV